ncbi:MAG: hypothetical protein H6839_16570 [Planctomycetes bacterium]|nr:hypothetical protein [Planctomycetota bacterium]
MLALSGLAIGGIVAGAILLLVVLVVAMRSKGQMAPASNEAPPAEPEAKPVEAPKAEPPKPEPVKAAEPVKADKPATLEVEALSPSMTDTLPALAEPTLSPSMTDSMPALDAEADEMRMGTDELPKMGTAEMPALDDGPMRFRTAPATELADAINSGTCPKCKAPTFVGDIETEDNTMYTLNGRCGACGHKAQVIDMRVS